MASWAGAAAIAVASLPSLSVAQIELEPGLDVWKTNPCDGAVDLPALPAGFFGVGSKETLSCPDFLLEGYPFPDICGPPNPFPESEYLTQIVWRDQHGNVVSADSMHRVTQTVQQVVPTPPYNFDTIIARGINKGADPDPALTFDSVDEEKMANITFCWLSLKGCKKKIVEFENGPDKEFEVYICLSDVLPQKTGRIKFIAKTFGAGGSGGGLVDLGDTTDPVSQAFEDGNFDFFDQNDDALGLPLFYKIIFVDCADPNNRYEYDNPMGLGGGPKSTLVWNHDPPEGSKEGDGDWTKRDPNRLCIPAAKDCWLTPPGGASVDIPEFFIGSRFFSFDPNNPNDPNENQSLGLPAFTLDLVGWPWDFPCGPPPPGCLPDDKFETVVVWRDQHGNVVSAESVHRVDSSTEVRPKHTEPRNYDTVVRRGEACFDQVGDTADVPIEIVALSLKSVDPINVSFQTGPDRQYDVFVCLSDVYRQEQEDFLRGAGQPFHGRQSLEGRMRMTATEVNPAGGKVDLSIGNPGDPQQQLFDNNIFQQAIQQQMVQQYFPLDFGFAEFPDALGLPVFFQLIFVEVDPVTGDFIDADPQTPEIDPANHIDAPFPFTAALFHNVMGGMICHSQRLPGDVNGDGVVDVFDIEGLVQALISPEDFRAQTGLDPNIAADCNGDRVLDTFDITCLIDLVTGNATVEDVARARLGHTLDIVNPQGQVVAEPDLQRLQALLAPDADDDGDGQSNLVEVTAGTDPFDASEHFHIEVISVEGDTVGVRWNTIVGYRYHLEYSATAEGDSWKSIPQTAVEAVETSTTLQTTRPPGEGKLFYRAVVDGRAD